MCTSIKCNHRSVPRWLISLSTAFAAFLFPHQWTLEVFLYLLWKRQRQHGPPVSVQILLSFLRTDELLAHGTISVLDGFEELPHCHPEAWHFTSPAAVFKGSRISILFPFWFVTAVLLDACFVIAVLLGVQWHCIALLTVLPE